MKKNKEPEKSTPEIKKIEKKEQGIVSKSLNRLLLKIILIIFGLCFLSVGGYFGINKLSEIKIIKKQLLAHAELERCAELVTVKSTYSDIISVKKTRIAGLAKSYSILRYEGILRAGIKDISLSDVRISDGGKRVEVVLPECEILGNDIKNIEVFDESRSVFVSVTLKEMVEELNLSRKVSEEKLIESGVLEDAKKQAVLAVSSMLKTAGFQSVTVN